VKETFLALALAASSSAEAQGASAFCEALETLAREAARTGRAQKPFVAQDEPFTFICGHRRGSRVQRVFCSAARDAVGLEFLHTFPWEVYDCLSARGLRPDINTTEQYTGLIDRGRVIHLAARWPMGVTIDVRYTPFEDDGPVAERFAGYRGRYDVTVARAD
jgi:hypothetical protein